MRSLKAQAAWLLLLVTLVFVGTGWLKAHVYSDQATALIGFGCRTPGRCFSEANRSSLPDSAVVFRSAGYDGQFFYYLGRELFGGARAVLDSESFRRSRIGLPLLAGPGLAAGEVGRRYGLPATLLALHLASIWVLARARPRRRLETLAFALNPFSLLGFTLCTADGAALSLAVIGALALEWKSVTQRASGIALIAFALLTRETLVVVPLALACARLLDGSVAWRTRLGSAALLACTLVPLLAWWHVVGFSFGLAAAHAGAPFSGAVAHLPKTDLERGVLLLILALGLVLGAVLLRERGSRGAGFALLGTAALVSLATVAEYWGTFANVGRLFTPMAAAPALLANGSRAPWRTAWVRFLGAAFALAWGVLAILMVVREATGVPLPFFVLGH